MNSTTSAKVLVTGGAGFIGSAVCRHLVSDLAQSVVVVDALTYAANLNSLASISHSPLYAFEHADIGNAEAIAGVLKKHQPDAILHLAAESHVDRSITGSMPFLQTNIMGTATLLEAVRSYLDGLTGEQRDAFRMLHISTDEVFGSLGPEGKFTEETAYDPSSPYSASKAASDHLVTAWTRTYGMPCITTNCSNNFGPFHFPEKLIPLSILNAIHGTALTVYGDGSNVRDWLYVEDHARALATVLSKGKVGAKYNIGGRSERTNLQVVRSICDLLDELLPKDHPHRDLITFVEDRPGHDLRYAIDSTKIERELGWQPRESFETGLRKTVEWYLANEAWWRPLREATYSGARLGIVATRKIG